MSDTVLAYHENRRALRTRHGAELQARLTAGHQWTTTRVIVGAPADEDDRIRLFVFGGSGPGR